jgi:hypothetical protein
MEPTHIRVHLRAGPNVDSEAITGLRDSGMTCGCAESAAFDIAGSAPSHDLADATHAIWQVWYSEGLYRQWRDGLVAPEGVDIVGFLELAPVAVA